MPLSLYHLQYIYSKITKAGHTETLLLSISSPFCFSVFFFIFVVISNIIKKPYNVSPVELFACKLAEQYITDRTMGEKRKTEKH